MFKLCPPVWQFQTWRKEKEPAASLKKIHRSQKGITLPERKKVMSKIKTILMFIPILVFILVGFSATISAQVTGAIFTTDVTCTGTDLNIYGAKPDVYIDGGPR